jgi:flagellar basal body rod protein FlgC
MISSVSSTTLASGLAAQSRVAETAAANIANVLTPDYQARRGQVVSASPAGASYVPLPPEGEVDLTRDVVDLMGARQAYVATARAFSSIARTEKEGLDVLA